MTDFEIIVVDLLIGISISEFIRLVFMLYAKFRPFFKRSKKEVD